MTRILLIEKKPSRRDEIRRMLSCDYLVDSVADAESAERQTRAGVAPPDLILACDAPPLCDGLNLVSNMRANARMRSVPVILLLPQSVDEARITALSAAANDHLFYPFTARELLSTIAMQLNMAHLRRDNKHQIAHVLDSISDGYLTVDAGGRFSYFNAASRRLFAEQGMDAQDIIGKPVLDVFPELPFSTLGRQLLQALSTHSAGTAENFYVPFQRWFVLRFLPLDNGGMSIIIEDITERKNAEQALRKNERLFRSLVDASNQTIWRYDKQIARIDEGSAAWWCQFTGQSEVQRTADHGGGWLQAVHEDDREAALTIWRCIDNSGCEPCEVQYRVRRADGQWRWLRVRGVPVKDEEKRIQEWAGTIADVTERKEAEEALQRSEQLLRLIVDSLPAVVTYVDRDLQYRFFNRRLCDWFGIDADQVHGRNLSEVLGEPAYARMRPKVQAVLNGNPVHYEAELPFRYGGRRAVDVRYVPDVRPDGTVEGYVGLIHDISERKAIEQALRSSEEQLAVELKAMKDLHSLTTRLLRAPDLQAALDDLLGAALELHDTRMGSMHLFDADSGVLTLAVQRGFDQRFSDRFHTITTDDLTSCGLALLSGERATIEDVKAELPAAQAARAVDLGFRAMQSTPLLTRAGDLIGIMTLHFAVPHRPGERELRMLDLYIRQTANLIERLGAEQALKQADRRKDDFIATLAHELRNPLAPISNALAILRRGRGSGATLQRAQDMLERQVTHMVRLVDDLLEVSRITRGSITLRRQQVELADVINNALETSGPLIEAGQHRLLTDLPAEPVYLYVDAFRLAQVLTNLLNNAAKYTPSGGCIWLTARQEGGHVMISIRDNGMGIAPEALPRVFEMFTQMEGAGRSQGGLGIGLPLARSLTEMHGGRLEAHSAGVGKGSEFAVHLPISDGQHANDLGIASDERKPSLLGPRRVLVVDDNYDAASSLGMVLEMLGAEVQVVHDGKSALSMFEVFEPDVVFLDIGMPGMDGYEVARRIREKFPLRNTLLVAVTGWSQEADRHRARIAGFNHHLVKPVDIDALEGLLVS